MEQTTKRCPYCGEEILAVAKKCKHCKSYLDPSLAPRAPAPGTVDRMLMPVGRPASAIAAGYLGLFAIFPLVGILAGMLAVICGIIALKRIKADPDLHGKGRAWFGIIVGSLFFVVQLVGGVLILNEGLKEQRKRRGRAHMSEVLRVDPDTEAGRFARFELIGWWDQQRLSSAKALVIGAGALGNEIIKNLALLGVGHVLVADLDRIEASNLSRSVLYREQDCGKQKASVAAERAREIYPQMRLQAFNGNITYDLGLGTYRWADVILAGLDNREARVAINRAAAKAGKPWIDGAIERLDGVARVFDPAVGPCYECTMSEVDWKMLESRRSCALLTRSEMEQGKVPTTPTTSSVIAGIQVQEAVKMLHGLETLSGQGFVFDGTHHQSYVVNYSRLESCPSHDAFEKVETLLSSVSETRAGQLLDRIIADLGPGAVIEFNHDLLESLTCVECGETTPMLTSLGKVTVAEGRCPKCGSPRTPNMYHTLGAGSPLLDRTLGELGVPAWDIIAGRRRERQRAYEFAGDRRAVLGEMEGS